MDCDYRRNWCLFGALAKSGEFGFEIQPFHFCMPFVHLGGGALEQGRSIHSQAIQMGFHAYNHISNALTSMNCKCGALKDVLRVFRTLDVKDSLSWKSRMAKYVQHRFASQAIDLFDKMKQQDVKVDAITFLGILSSRRHADLVKEGQFYFNSMSEHSLELGPDHSSFIVDFFGRAGLLEKTWDVIKKMSIHPNAVKYGSLLSSSLLHGSIGLCIKAIEDRLLFQLTCAVTYLQLANLSAGVGWWDHATRMRKLMKDKWLKTSPSCS